MSARDEFYVGYLPSAPPALAAWVRRAVALLLALAAGVALVLAATMSPFSSAVFEFGTLRTFEGVVSEHPVPALVLARPGDGPAGRSRYLLVDFGKHGAAQRVLGLDGRRVRVRGTLAHGEGSTLLELAGEVETLDDPIRAASPLVDQGERTLRGEIVDSKCYLGVMKPGNRKPHRACAVRCISGGIPPLLLVRDGSGEATHYLLVGPDGEPLNDALLDRVAEPVTVTGRVVRRDDWLFLHAEADDIVRLE